MDKGLNMKKCGFIIRVSTDRQARSEEGSLKNQLQKLQAHIQYKNSMSGEEWVEVQRYVLKGISGKDSVKSQEFAKLFNDIRIGKINTVLFTDLDRVSRSVKDFLNFFEALNKYNVEFVCLNQNYDTTSPHGELLTTMTMALAEFERKQTSKRTKDATLVRAERGLWNGGRLLGYDLDPIKKGHLVLNEKEKALVNFAFDTYLQCGSIPETAKIMNRHGYRTKEYTSKREKFHPAEKFSYSSTKLILTNYAYIGKKEINKRKKVVDQATLPENDRYRIVDATWEPIVDEEKFFGVQALLKKNRSSKHNVAKPIKHNYLLNGGLLWCEKCGKEMEGRSGTGARNVRYYYYRCKNEACQFKVPANEIEGIILNRLKELSSQRDILGEIVKFTNGRLQKALPQLKEQKTLLQKERTEIRSFADKIMNKWASLATDQNSVLLKEKLDELGRRRQDIETGIQTLEQMIDEIQRESVSQELVMLALNKFTDVFDHIQPYQQKELLGLVLHKAVLAPDSIKIALYGRPPETGLLPGTESEMRSRMVNWLPGQDSNLQPSG
jgi:site-specific DNA recombinase